MKKIIYLYLFLLFIFLFKYVSLLHNLKASARATLRTKGFLKAYFILGGRRSRLCPMNRY